MVVLAGCVGPDAGPGGDPSGDPTSQPPENRIDFARCPFDGLNNTPPSCENDATRYTAGSTPSTMPCLDQSLPGATTVRVRKDVMGPVVEITPEPGRLWLVAVVFGDDADHAYTWMQPEGTSWTYLEGAPTTGPFHLLLTSFQLAIANATGPQTAAQLANLPSAVNWVAHGATLIPLIVLGEPPSIFVDATLPLGPPPFQRTLVNAHLYGQDFEVLLSDVRNVVVGLELQDPNPNGLACALPG